MPRTPWISSEPGNAKSKFTTQWDTPDFSSSVPTTCPRSFFKTGKCLVKEKYQFGLCHIDLHCTSPMGCWCHCRTCVKKHVFDETCESKHFRPDKSSTLPVSSLISLLSHSRCRQVKHMIWSANLTKMQSCSNHSLPQKQILRVNDFWGLFRARIHLISCTSLSNGSTNETLSLSHERPALSRSLSSLRPVIATFMCHRWCHFHVTCITQNTHCETMKLFNAKSGFKCNLYEVASA